MGYSSPYAGLPTTHHISREQSSTTVPGIYKTSLTMETQLIQQDDSSLMDLGELDSHLSMFDSSLARDSPASTPDNGSHSASGESLSNMSLQSNTIIVEPPDEIYLPPRPKYQFPQAKFGDPKLNNAVRTGYHTKLTPDGNVHLRLQSARNSMASSRTTELDDNSSALSSISSKASSPTDFDSKTKVEGASSPQKQPSKYDVRPKVSIPTDIAPSEYARQCIAAAESSRLNPYSLHPEEYAMLRNHLTSQQVTTYLNIRNGILRLWTRNPMIEVMRDEAIGCAKDQRWFETARVSYEWLVRRGYINFGCVESSAEPKNQRGTKRKRRTIAVLGAGMSGLGCARQLEGLFAHYEKKFHAMGEDPPRVVVLEGRDRIGGRVYSHAFKTKPRQPSLPQGSRHTAEMGGMIITGFDRGNPLNIIVRGQLALPYHALKPDTTIYDANGTPVNYDRDQHAEKLFNYILDRVSEYKYKMPTPPTADGDKDLLDAGRDPSQEGHLTIDQAEQAPEIKRGNSKEKRTQTPELQMVPVSSDRLTGRSHLEPGIPAVHTAAYKAKEIGWDLRPGVGIERDLDLETAVSSKWATLGSVFDEAIRQYSRIVDIVPVALRLINWHVANLEYSNATTINKLSLGGWDLDAGNEWEGKHTMIKGGYQQVPRGLLNLPRPLAVRKKSKVSNITYSSDGNGTSSITCADGTKVEADAIVSTIPLGVLKEFGIIFEPALPDWKVGAIQRIGYGVLNKVVLVYREAFWDEDLDIFGTLRNPPYRFTVDQADYFTQRGRFFQWFNITKTTGLPTLLALMAGDAAFTTESTPNDMLISEATKVLRTVFGDNAVPPPVEAIVTRWKSDEFSRGSYSYTGANFKQDDYDVMAKPVGNLFFAGEHTCGTHPATVHGAYISGLRAASEVLESLIGPIQIPEPLVVPKDSGLKRKSDAAEGPKDPKQARLEAYEVEIWNAIYAKLGDRPWRPANNYANPYRMYSKDNWEEAKRKCEEGRRPGKGKPIPNEVKKMVAKMWKEAPEDVKQPYNERAEVQKQAYAEALGEYTVNAGEWDKAALEFRSTYEKEHPSVPGPDEDASSPWRKDRKAKRGVSGYAEDDSASDTEV